MRVKYCSACLLSPAILFKIDSFHVSKHIIELKVVLFLHFTFRFMPVEGSVGNEERDASGFSIREVST